MESFEYWYNLGLNSRDKPTWNRINQRISYLKDDYTRPDVSNVKRNSNGHRSKKYIAEKIKEELAKEKRKNKGK